MGQGGGLFAMARRLLVLSAIDDRGVSALVVGAGNLLVLAHLLGKALVVSHFRHNGRDRRSEERGDFINGHILIFHYVVQQSRNDNVSASVGCIGYQVGDFDQMVQVGLRSVALTSLVCVLSCGELGRLHDCNDVIHSDLAIDKNVGIQT